MNTTTRTALLILALTLGSTSAARAQDKAPKGKQSEKAPKKEPAKDACPPGATCFGFDDSTPDAPESELPAITPKGKL